MVAAAAAIVQSRYNIPRTGQCTLDHLKSTAYRPPAVVKNPSLYGAGILNVYNAWITTPAELGTPSCIPGPI
jgi:hypothetical protein